MTPFRTLVLLALLPACGDKDPTDSSADTADPGDTADTQETDQAGPFTVTSTSFPEGGTIPVVYTCDGDNTSPALSWENAPQDTVAFALTVRDPDAPGGDCHHWGVVNLPVHILQVDEGASGAGTLPEGSWETLNYKGQPGYAGPCPPTGAEAHQYNFTVLALSTTIPDPGDAPALEDMLTELEAATLDQANLMGFYGR